MSDSVITNIDSPESQARVLLAEMKKTFPSLYGAFFSPILMEVSGRSKVLIQYAQGSTTNRISAEETHPLIVSLRLFSIMPEKVLELCVRIALKNFGLDGDYDDSLPTGTFSNDGCTPVLFGIAPKPDDRRYIKREDGSYSFKFLGIEFTYFPVKEEPRFKEKYPLLMDRHGWGVFECLFIGYGSGDLLDVEPNAEFDGPISTEFQDVISCDFVDDDGEDVIVVPGESTFDPAVCDSPGYLSVVREDKVERIVCKYANVGDCALFLSSKSPLLVAYKSIGASLKDSTLSYNYWIFHKKNKGPGIKRNSSCPTRVAFRGGRFVVMPKYFKVKLDGEDYLLGEDDYALGSFLRGNNLLGNEVPPIKIRRKTSGLRFLSSERDFLDTYLLGKLDEVIYRIGVGGFYRSIVTQLFIIMGIPFVSDVYKEIGWYGTDKKRAARMESYAHRIMGVFGGSKIEGDPKRFVLVDPDNKYFKSAYEIVFCLESHGIVVALEKMGLLVTLADKCPKGYKLMTGVIDDPQDPTPWACNQWLIDDSKPGCFKVMRLKDLVRGRIFKTCEVELYPEEVLSKQLLRSLLEQHFYLTKP